MDTPTHEHEKDIKTNSFCNFSIKIESYKHKVVAPKEKSLSHVHYGTTDISKIHFEIKFVPRTQDVLERLDLIPVSFPSKNRLGYMPREIKPGRENELFKRSITLSTG